MFAEVPCQHAGVCVKGGFTCVLLDGLAGPRSRSILFNSAPLLEWEQERQEVGSESQRSQRRLRLLLPGRPMGTLTTVRKMQDLEQGAALERGPAGWDASFAVGYTRNSFQGWVGIGPGAGDRAVGVVSTETGPGDLRVGGFICSLLHHSTFAGTRCADITRHICDLWRLDICKGKTDRPISQTYVR